MKKILLKSFSVKSFTTLLIASTIACSNNGTEAPELNNTEKGVATGAVLGAGLGALVGSTAGEPAAGLVLGSVAGATSGGIIGSSFDDQDRRLDALDKNAGINTKKSSAAKSTSRSSLKSNSYADSGSSDSSDSSDSSPLTSFTDNFWISNDSNSNSNNSVVEDEYPNNRPSKSSARAKSSTRPVIVTSNVGSSRVASSDIDISEEDLPKPNPKSRVSQIREESRSRLDEVPVTKPTTSTLPSATTSKKEEFAKIEPPTIELQKPKAELPAAKLSKVAPKPVTVVAPAAASAKLPVKPPAELPSAKKELAKVDQKVDQVVEKSTEKTEEIKQEAVKQADTAQEVAKAKTDVKSLNSKAPKCEQGQKEADRAMSSTSDSDKVFYLRRALQACPKETHLRVELGKVYRRLGLKEDARKEFNSALETDPANDSAEEELSIMMLEGK